MLLPGGHDPVAQAGQIDCRVEQGFHQNGGIQARLSRDRSEQCVDGRGVAGIQISVSPVTDGLRIRSRIPGLEACQQGVQNLLHIHPP
jgi:hypothetical protein